MLERSADGWTNTSHTYYKHYICVDYLYMSILHANYVRGKKHLYYKKNLA